MKDQTVAFQKEVEPVMDELGKYLSVLKMPALLIVQFNDENLMHMVLGQGEANKALGRLMAIADRDLGIAIRDEEIHDEG